MFHGLGFMLFFFFFFQNITTDLNFCPLVTFGLYVITLNASYCCSPVKNSVYFKQDELNKKRKIKKAKYN